VDVLACHVSVKNIIKANVCVFLVVSFSVTDIVRLRIKLLYCLMFTKPPFLAFEHSLNKMTPDAKWCSCLQEIFLEDMCNAIQI